MRVDSGALDTAGANVSDLQILRFEDDEWTALNTSVHSQNEGGVVLAADTQPGTVFAVRASAPPTAAAETSATTVEPGEPVVLDGSASTTPYGDIVAYEWRAGGRTSNESVTTVSFDEAGSYTVELTVRNDAGETATTAATVTVADDAQPSQPTTEPTTTELASNDGPTMDAATETTGGSGPGFGVAVVVVGLFAGLLARRRG